MSRLRNGQPFPLLEVPAVGGGTLSLPGDLAGSYGVVLIYRGSWCPYCNAQLAAFSRAADRLTELGVKVVALSVDDEETSAALARLPRHSTVVPRRAHRRRDARRHPHLHRRGPRQLPVPVPGPRPRPGRHDRHLHRQVSATSASRSMTGSGLIPVAAARRSGCVVRYRTDPGLDRWSKPQAGPS